VDLADSRLAVIVRQAVNCVGEITRGTIGVNITGSGQSCGLGVTVVVVSLGKAWPALQEQIIGVGKGHCSVRRLCGLHCRQRTLAPGG